MVALILVEQNLKYTTKPFTYLVPLKYQDEIKIGMRVTVPFGKKLLSGFVLKLAPELKETPEYKLKEIMNLIDKKPILNEELILLGKTIKNQTLSPLITVYQAMLPSFLKAKIKTGDNRAQFKRITLKADKSVVKEYINNNKRATAQITILNKLLTTKYLNKNELSTSAVNSLNEKN